MKIALKRILSVVLAVAMLSATSFSLVACDKNDSLLDPQNPVTLTMWHVYGEQADSPMAEFIKEFNETEGREKGVIIDVTMLSNTSQIGKKLLDAQMDKAGLPDMPDLFSCHTPDARNLGAQNLLDWAQLLSEEELQSFVPEFVEDGMIDGNLSVLPVSKSTSLLFVAGGVFDRFAADKNVSFDDLQTWDGFFDVAQKYYDWSGGKPFCALDYLVRLAELCSLANGESDIVKDDWYDSSAPAFRAAFERFALAIAKGHIIVSDMYANTQVMTGQTCAGIGSSAAVLYYNEKITYPDNTSEDMKLKVLPLPQSQGKPNFAFYSGVGLCAYKTTEQKAEAATVFARWFTEKQRNIEFVLSTGYIPVRVGAFDALGQQSFKSEAYESLNNALSTTVATCTFAVANNFDGYPKKTSALYATIRKIQKQLPEKYAAGESAEQIALEIMAALDNPTK